MNTIRRMMILFGVLLVLYTLIPQTVFGAEENAVSKGCHTLDAAVPIAGDMLPIENAQAALLYEVNTETLMFVQNADTPLYPTSFVKIMTAYVSVCEADLSEEVIVREDVLSTIPTGAASADLSPGEILTVKDLLHCMLLSSANDAAAVLADHIGGSQGAFVEMMNRYAADIGCTNTHFVNAHGLHSDLQLSTARDTAKILNAALKNEAFREIWTAKNYEVPATNKSSSRYLKPNNYLQNKDKVISYYDERVTGGRTGVMEDGQRSLACTAESDGIQVICVIIGSQSTLSDDGKRIKIYGAYQEAKQLLNLGLDAYKPLQLLYPGQSVRQLSVTNGTNDLVLECREHIGTVIPKSADESVLNYQYTNVNPVLKAPVNKGDLIAHLEIWYDGICTAQTELYALNQVRSVLTENQENVATGEKNGSSGTVKVLLFVIVGILIIFIMIRGVPLIRRLRSKNREKRYRKYRGRSR